MGVKAGILGLPNSGKTTLFNLLTRLHAPTAPYPFTTIDPNHGVVEVPDERIDRLNKILSPPRTVPAAVEFVDVAGLVKGASKGEGLGNQFLSEVRGVDTITHVLRFFSDSQVAHVMGGIDPARDYETIEMELLLADREVLERRFTRTRELVRKIKDSSIEIEHMVLERCLKALDEAVPLRSFFLTREEKAILCPSQPLTLKPVVYVANCDEGEDSAHVFAHSRQTPPLNEVSLIKVYAKLEEELCELPPRERENFLQAYGVEEAGLHLLIREVYRALGLLTFFTFNEKELRAWEIPSGTKAPAAAGKIHTDMEKGFIKAEVVGYTDLISKGSMEILRREGKVRLEGREYEVQDGDVIYFRFSA